MWTAQDTMQRTRASNNPQPPALRVHLRSPRPRNQFGLAAARLGSDGVVYDIIPRYRK